MSDFDKNNIGSYSWEPDKTAPGKIEIGGAPKAMPQKVIAPKKKGGAAKIGLSIIAMILCILLSGIAAFVGSFLGSLVSMTAVDVTCNMGEALMPGIFGGPFEDHDIPNKEIPSEKDKEAGPDTNTPSQSVSQDGEITGSTNVTVNKADSPVAPRDPSQVSTVANVASKVGNSVVEIFTETVVSGNIFSQYVTSGAGSGVIVAKEGYIITNNHVIAGASNITVRTTDGTEYKATLIGADSASDIAVIKIEADANKLTVATLGNSDLLVVGEPVIAIGNPLGSLGGTVTNGIISALDREIEIDGERMTLLQHNAAVNPGNSGGALFNENGELIGIVNAKSSGSDVEGIGFAIPINDAYSVMEQLLEYGYVRGRVYLGLNLIDIQDSYTAMYYRVNTFGVYVYNSEFIEDLKQGDRISAIDGEEVSSYGGMKAILAKKNIGDEIVITVVRQGKVIDVKAVCREYVPETVDFEQ